MSDKLNREKRVKEEAEIVQPLEWICSKNKLNKAIDQTLKLIIFKENEHNNWPKDSKRRMLCLGSSEAIEINNR